MIYKQHAWGPKNNNIDFNDVCQCHDSYNNSHFVAYNFMNILVKVFLNKYFILRHIFDIFQKYNFKILQ